MTTSEIKATQRPFPRRSFLILGGLSLLGVAALAFMKLGADFLNERFNLNPGIPNVLLIVAALLGMMLWFSWLTFVARKWIWGLLVLLLPVLGLVLFHPIFGGDAEILGWEPRFWKSSPRLVAAVQNENNLASSVDLARVTAFDFPQFLGQQRNGVVSNVNLRADWDGVGPRLLWKQPIGEGWAGFAIVNGYAITQEQRDADECVTCYDIQTGRLKWIYSSRRRHEDLIKLGKIGPRATPSIDGGLVYTMGGTGVLDCLNGADGSLLWSVDVAELVGVTRTARTNALGMSFTTEDSSLEWGRSGSPLIVDNMVIVPGGGPKHAFEQKDIPNSPVATLLAFDKLTGKEIWRGGERQIAYGSPSVVTIDGTRQIVLVAESTAVGHDADSGKELWSHARSGTSSADANCSQVTFISGNRLLFSKGYNMGGEVVEIERTESANSKTGWQVVSLKSDHRLLKTKLTNPVVVNNHAYSLSDGYLECTQLHGPFTEDPSQWLVRKWKQRGRFGNGQILLVGDKLLVHSENGELMLVAANPDQYQLLGTIKTVAGICWNTFGLYGNRVLVRSDQEMACFKLPLEEDSIGGGVPELGE